MKRFQILIYRRLPFFLAALLILITGLILVFWLPRLLAPIAVLERLLALVAAVAVCCDRSPAEFKLAQVTLILLLPWVGAVVCFFFLNGEQPKDFKGKAAKHDGDLPLAALSENLSALPVCRVKTADYFPTGRDMYRALLNDLKGAKKFVYLEFYIAAEGVFLSDIFEILSERARAGVDVRLVFDGFGTAALSPDLVRDAERRGMRIRIFRPLRFPTKDSERRDHKKIAVIDGKIAYTGGVNLADEYIGEVIRFGHWKDTAVRVTGGAAAVFCTLFCRTWNALDTASPISPPRAVGGTVPCAVIADEADEKGDRVGRDALLHLFAAARRRLYVNTPYLAPDSALMRALQCAALSGADVRLMIPHIPDKKLPFFLTRSYAAELERNGVKVMEYTDGFLHAKSVVSDDVTFISSYNLDFRSLYLQSECGIAIRQSAFADKVAADFLSAWEGGTPLPAQGKAKELCGRVLRLAAPIF